MALIKCPECGKEISDTAKQCPNCGYSFKKQNDLPDLSNAVSSVWQFLYSLFKDGKYWKALIVLAISVTLGVLSIYYAFESDHMDWILFIGGILLCLVGTFILFGRPIEFGRNKASGKIMKISTILLVLGLIAIVAHGVVRIVDPWAFSYEYQRELAKKQKQNNGDGSDNAQQGKWEYAGETNLAGARIHYATILAEEDESIVLCLTYDPDNYIEANDLVVKYFDKSINIVSNRATIKRGISFKFDDGGIINLTPSTSPSNDVYITDKSISIRDESEDFGRLMQLLKTSKVCKVEITTSNGIKTYTFNVAGLNWPAF